MIINDPYAGGAFARLGRSLGQGVSEALPKEADRFRQASALKNLSQNTSANPLSQVGSLIAGGFEPQQAASLLPLLQQQAANQGFLSEFGSGGGALPFSSPPEAISSVGSESPQRAEAPRPTISAPRAQDQISPSARMLQPLYGVQRSPEEIKAIAAQRFEKNRAFYQNDPNKAIQQVENEEAQRVKINAQNEQRLAIIDKHFDKTLEDYLHKQGQAQFSDLPGNLINDLRREAYDDTSLDPVEAAKKYAQEGLDFAKDNRALKDMDKLSIRAGTRPETKKRSLDNIRKSYAKYDKLDEFRSELINKKMSPAYADFVTYPVKDNPEINNYIADLSKGDKSFLSKLFSYDEPTGKEPEIAKQIAKNLKTSDSLNAIALAIKAKGHSGTAFLKEMNKLVNEGKVQLTSNQQRIFSDPDLSLKPTLQDILIFENGKISPIERIEK